jgi:hypothetical protein
MELYYILRTAVVPIHARTQLRSMQQQQVTGNKK